MSRNKVGKLIKLARSKKGLTQGEAGKLLKLSPAYLGLLERNSPTHMSPRVAGLLIKRLGCPRSLNKLVAIQNKAAAKDQAKWRKVMARNAKKKAA